MELTEEVVILENSRLVIWSWFYENGERGGRGSPRLKWLALFQKMMEEVAAELVQKKLLTFIVTVKVDLPTSARSMIS